MEKHRSLLSSHTRAIPVMTRVVCALLLCIGFCFGTQPAWAAPTTSAQAAQAVQAYLAQDTKPLGATFAKTVARVTTYLGTNKLPLYYVVSLKPSGFFVVSADNLIEPIVAFSATGTYDPAAKSPLVALLTGDLQERTNTVRAPVGRAITKQSLALAQEKTRAGTKWQSLLMRSLTKSPAVATVSDVRVAPFIATMWNQQTSNSSSTGPACYNYYTPSAVLPPASTTTPPTPLNYFYTPGNPSNDLCGCVATALAQLMYFWQYPLQGVGAGQFYSVTVSDGIAVPVTTTEALRGGDGNGGAYQWSKMDPNPISYAAFDPVLQQIGDLCHDTAVASHMEFSPNESGAYLNDAGTALHKAFFYADAIDALNESNQVNPALLDMINANLNATQPVLLGIDDPIYGGHCVVCDGYGYDATNTLYHHLNMGWGGFDDTWYNLPNISASIYNFSIIDECLFNVTPNGTGEIVSGRVTTQGGQPVNGLQVTATAASGATYPPATTNAEGIYAITGLPSNTTFTLSTFDGVNTDTCTATTGASVSAVYTPPYSLTSVGSCGDVWTADITVSKTFSITTSSLPATTIGVPYSTTLQSTGGTAPISWYALASGHYAEQLWGMTLYSYQQTGAEWYGGYNTVTIPLPFSINYYGQSYSSIAVSSSGYIDLPTFNPSTLPTLTNFKASCRICPLWADQAEVMPYNFSVYTYNNAVLVSWYALSTLTGLNIEYQAYLYQPAASQAVPNPPVQIDFVYSNVDPSTNAIVGFSNGDGVNYTLSTMALLAMANSQGLDFYQDNLPLPQGLTLNRTTGVISGTTVVPGDYPVKIEAKDSIGLTDTKLFRLSVASVIQDQSLVTNENTSINFTLGPTSFNGNALTYAIVESAKHGKITGTAPYLTYTPNAGYTGFDYVVVTGTDNVAFTSPPATITIRVNAPPVANNQTVGMMENTQQAPTSLTIALSATDIDFDTLTANILSLPFHGTLTNIPNNAGLPTLAYTYTPNIGFIGQDSFTFKVNDGYADSNVATVTINVSGPLNGVSFTSTPTSPVSINTPVTLTAKTSGGSVVVYSFLVNGKIVQDFSTANPYVWVPITAGSYTLQVQAKDTAGADPNAVVSSAKMTYVVTSPLFAVALKPLTSPQLSGTPITLTATATGGANVQYQFLVNGLPKTQQTNSSSNTALWNTAANPALAGTYTITVLASDLSSAHANQTITSKPLSITINKNVTLSKPEPASAGSGMTLTATALGFQNPRYHFRVGTTDLWGRWLWTDLPDANYYATNSVNWLPKPNVTYTVTVWVRESTSTQVYDVCQSQQYKAQ